SDGPAGGRPPAGWRCGRPHVPTAARAEPAIWPERTTRTIPARVQTVPAFLATAVDVRGGVRVDRVAREVPQSQGAARYRTSWFRSSRLVIGANVWPKRTERQVKGLERPLSIMK